MVGSISQRHRAQPRAVIDMTSGKPYPGVNLPRHKRTLPRKPVTSIEELAALKRKWMRSLDEIEEFAQFQVDFTRFKTEVEGTLKVPLTIYKAVGNISSRPPKFTSMPTSS